MTARESLQEAPRLMPRIRLLPRPRVLLYLFLGVPGWWLLYALGYGVFGGLRTVANGSGFPDRAGYVIQFDRFLFAGSDPAVWLQAQLFSPPDFGLLESIAAATHLSFFVVPHVVGIAVCIWRRQLFGTYVALFLGVHFAAIPLFFLVPTAPPWLAAGQGELDPVYRLMLHFIHGGIDFANYDALTATMGDPNPLAAMPSLHMAVPVMVFLWCRRVAPRLAPIPLLYCGLMAFSLVYLGEHYMVDLAVGALLAYGVHRLLRGRRIPMVNAQEASLDARH